VLLAVPVSAAISTTPVVATWTEPSAGYGFLYSAVLGATSSIDLSMYELRDSTMIQDLIKRAHAGVNVHVLLNQDYEGASENAAAFSQLRSGGVHVAWAPAGQIFHAKYLVIDGRVAYIGTGNLVTYDYASTRDFWVKVTSSSDVRAVSSTFARDFVGSSAPSSAPGLVWSPGSTNALVTLIASAHRTLLVENEEMDVYAIESALEAAAQRGVSVTVVMTQDSSWSSALSALSHAGVHVRQLSYYATYIHAKVICADCTTSSGTAFIGSENFSTSSLVYNRELGVITTSPVAVQAVRAAVLADAAQGS
jgi:phosphatidylserine/phosphatidylglycerophosphate/cardiolipin synthase-like enzyme